MAWLLAGALLSGFLFLIWRHPVHTHLTGRFVDGRLALQAEVRCLGGRLRARRLARTFSGLRWLPPVLRLLEPGRGVSPGETALDHLARRWRVTRLEVGLSIGAGSPALTAAAYGLTWGVVGAVLEAFQTRWPVEAPPRVRIDADFRRARLSAEFRCILTYRVGDAVIAGWLELRKRLTRHLVRETAPTSPPDQPAHSAEA